MESHVLGGLAQGRGTLKVPEWSKSVATHHGFRVCNFRTHTEKQAMLLVVDFWVMLMMLMIIIVILVPAEGELSANAQQHCRCYCVAGSQSRKDKSRTT